jgi:hypothetical protein
LINATAEPQWKQEATNMNQQQRFQQAYREARANGRIGYLRLGDPRARMAAAESLRCRLDSDETALARKRYTTLEADLF